MSQDFKIDLGSDPAKVFVNLLIWSMKSIEVSLYCRQPDSISVSRQLRGLIECLDEQSKKALEKQHTLLVDYEEGRSPAAQMHKSDFMPLYSEIASYLHRTYLQQVNYVRALNPHPKPIGEEEPKGEEKENDAEPKVSTV